MMCCIAACYEERLPEDLIDAMLLWNNDGFGMAWIENGKVRWQKGMNTVTAKLFARHLPLPYVAHARLATIGGEKNGLAHPFPIQRGSSARLRGSANRVLFHNGHIGNWRAIVRASDGKKTPIMGDKWSDSRAIAHVIATRGLKLLEELPQNRFAVLDPNGIELFGDGWGTAEGLDSIKLSSDVERRTYLTVASTKGAYYGAAVGVYPDRWD